MAREVRGLLAGKAIAAGQSIQELLLPFPIAFLIGTLATDVVFALTGQPVWSRVSLCLLCVGLAVGIVCVICGLANLAVPRRRREQRVAWIQFPGIELAVLLTIINVALRVGDPAAAVSRTGLMLSTVVTIVLVVAGWSGGELTFTRRGSTGATRQLR
jgi:uncharacterized membrane protein